MITPSNRAPSHGGHGTLEILGVIQVLEANDIPCCLIGTSALIYYGADRVRGVNKSLHSCHDPNAKSES